jgi:hypothetical protein
MIAQGRFKRHHTVGEERLLDIIESSADVMYLGSSVDATTFYGCLDVHVISDYDVLCACGRLTLRGIV